MNEKFSGVQNPTILKRKPNLKLCSNHFKSGKRIYRTWSGSTAMRDGNGWYIERRNSK
jgi:hypothetical protein